MLVEEEQGFHKGAQWAPWPQELQKSPAWIGLSELFLSYFCHIARDIEADFGLTITLKREQNMTIY